MAGGRIGWFPAGVGSVKYPVFLDNIVSIYYRPEFIPPSVRFINAIHAVHMQQNICTSEHSGESVCTKPRLDQSEGWMKILTLFK